MRIILNAAMALCLAQFAGTSLAADVMQPGAWKTNMVVMATKPGTQQKVKVGESSNTICFTKEFLATDPYLSPKVNEEKMRQKGAQCTIKDYARSGNKASWLMSCVAANGIQVESDFRVSVSAKQSTTTIHQKIGNGARAVRSTTRAEAGYVGDCDSSMPRM